MKIIKCPEEYDKFCNEIACFMSGGTSNTEWHDRFIARLKQYKLMSLVLYNPYNPNITDHEERVKWEYKYLNQYIDDLFIFSVYFDQYTKQPISMYELGRITILCQSKFLNLKYQTKTGGFVVQQGFPTVISVHPNSPIKDDVITQCKLAGLNAIIRTPEEHADAVSFIYRSMKE